MGSDPYADLPPEYVELLRQLDREEELERAAKIDDEQDGSVQKTGSRARPLTDEEFARRQREGWIFRA